MDLRQELNHIVNSGEFAVDEHADAVEKLKQKTPHTIVCLSPPAGIPFNCFSHAFDVVESAVVNNLLGSHGGLEFGTDFVERLIDDGTLTANDNGAVIIYFSDGRPRHAGKIDGERVTSKWGIGYLWEHGIWEVPAPYGNECRRFDAAKPAKIEESFQKYAEHVLRE